MTAGSSGSSTRRSGDEYRRLAKGGDDGIELTEEELRHLWQRTQAGDACQVALEAFHRLLLRAQDRLISSEQEAWVKALELRRQVDSHAPGLARSVVSRLHLRAPPPTP